MFSSKTTCLIYGKQAKVAQRMLDFDFLCGREPSVVGFVSQGNNGSIKLSYGKKEFLCPIYSNFGNAKQTGATCLLNFSSQRSATSSTKEAMQAGWIDTIVVVAEGIPERESREIIALKHEIKEQQNRDVLLIGPSTVGGIGAGRLRLGYTGGSLDNMIGSKLYTPGSVGLVSKSAGMMNELCRVIAQRTDGIHTAISIGGDRYPFSTFEEIVLRYQAIDQIKMIVLLGEVGNKDELVIADLIRKGKITKPVVAWISGGFAEQTQQEVQFGHAGAKANANEEKASYKINHLREAGIHVPDSYRSFGDMIRNTFEKKCNPVDPLITKQEAIERLAIIQKRKKSSFSSSISDERGEELLYDGITISKFVESQSIARVIGHLWLKKELPDWALEFVTTILILLADHGPAVSGAHNTIVSARAGKDLVSSLISGLATIGPRFGGAIDEAAQSFFASVLQSESADNFVKRHKQAGKLIMGIGHRIKSKYNPDIRCSLLQKQAERFPSKDILSYAQAVENITLDKKPSLILNVDGYIGAMLVDMLLCIGMSTAEIEKELDAGISNAFFVLARSIGFIGHYLDQQRLDEGLYRTPWDDILYL